VLGATVRDIDVTWKVDVAARFADQLGLGTRVDVLREHLGTQTPVGAIEGCDVVMSCVDRHVPRLLHLGCIELGGPRLYVTYALRPISSGTGARIRLAAGTAHEIVLIPT